MSADRAATDEARDSRSHGVVLRPVRPPAPQSRAAADHLAVQPESGQCEPV